MIDLMYLEFIHRVCSVCGDAVLNDGGIDETETT